MTFRYKIIYFAYVRYNLFSWNFKLVASVKSDFVKEKSTSHLSTIIIDVRWESINFIAYKMLTTHE